MVKVIDDIIIVFLMQPLSLEKEEQLEKEFKELFKKLKDVYKLNIKGSYNINCYNDKIYGVILEIKKNKIDYCDYFDSIDMQINVIDTIFLYQIKDYFFIDKKMVKNLKLYEFNNKLYIELKDKKDLIKIIENSKIIYKSSYIRKNGKKIDIML